MSSEVTISEEEPQDPVGSVPGLVAGQRYFDRYLLQGILGCGGMGVVWLAWDEKLQQNIALKFLPDLLRLDAAAADDLKRETRRSLQLTHPNILRIHDYVDDASAAAIAMEYIDGPTLAVLQLHRPNRVLSLLELSSLLPQICEALDYAHQRAKVVHRDLKPANLMITQTGEIKVADFGISASISETRSGFTIRRGTTGTLNYMSPQQARGLQASASDDIYALGATIFALLTSKPVFFRGEVYQQLLHEVPPLLSSRRQELEINTEPIPPIWDHVVARCLSKDPTLRPKTAGEVWQLIQNEDFATSTPVVQMARSGLDQSLNTSTEADIRNEKKRPSPLNLAILVSLFIALSTLAAYWLLPKSHSPQTATTANNLPVNQPSSRPAAPSPPPSLLASASGAAQLPPPPTPAAHPWLPTTPQPLPEGSQQTTWSNSLNMVFKSIPGTQVLFSIYDTRVEDFRAYALASGLKIFPGMFVVGPVLNPKDGATVLGLKRNPQAIWESPGFPQTDNDPVVGVSWNDANLFCQWLTKQERSKGLISATQSYRLPTDAEWSKAAGDAKYPWGSDRYPPPDQAGNYRDLALKSCYPALNIYHLNTNDGFGYTSPVGSFPPNLYGLFDMGGNVWQWCQDFYLASMDNPIYVKEHPSLADDKGGKTLHVIRGGSWYEVGKEVLETSFRRGMSPWDRSAVIGFRVVLTN